MLVTVTTRFRVHRDEVLCAIVRGNMLVLRFASMKPVRVPVDDLTDEAREWLLPSIAPRDIPFDVGVDEGEEEEEEMAGEDDEVEVRSPGEPR